MLKNVFVSVPRAVSRTYQSAFHLKNEYESFTLILFSKLDCISWVIESSQTAEQKTVKRLVQQIVAIYVAAAHQLPVVSIMSIKSANDLIVLHRSSILQYTTYVRVPDILSHSERKWKNRLKPQRKNGSRKCLCSTVSCANLPG